jgi:hypothetical protein
MTTCDHCGHPLELIEGCAYASCTACLRKADAPEAGIWLQPGESVELPLKDDPERGLIWEAGDPAPEPTYDPTNDPKSPLFQARDPQRLKAIRAKAELDYVPKAQAYWPPLWVWILCASTTAIIAYPILQLLGWL